MKCGGRGKSQCPHKQIAAKRLKTSPLTFLQKVRKVLFNGNTNTSSVRIPGKTLKEKLLQFERMPILEALKEAGSKIGKAAQLLGIDRSALFGKKRKHRIIQLLRR